MSYTYEQWKRPFDVLSPLPALVFLLCVHTAMFYLWRFTLFNLLNSDDLPPIMIQIALGSGLGFDLRYAFFTCLPAIVLLSIPTFENPLKENSEYVWSFFRKITCLSQSVIFTALTIIYFLDFGLFIFQQQIVKTELVSFGETIFNSLGTSIMILQKFPMGKLFLAFMFFVVFYNISLNYFLKKVKVLPISFKKSKNKDAGEIQEEVQDIIQAEGQREQILKEDMQRESVTPLAGFMIRAVILCAVLFFAYICYEQKDVPHFPDTWQKSEAV